MTEAEWLACEDPAEMLAALMPTRSGDASPIQAEGGRARTSDRLLRLFACAVCRQVWNRLTDDIPCPYCKDADFSVGDFGAPMMGGQEPYATRAKNYFRSKCSCSGTGRINRSRRAVEVAELFADGEATAEELATAYHDAGGLRSPFNSRIYAATLCAHRDDGRAVVAGAALKDHKAASPPTQAALLRCIVGNPFRRPGYREGETLWLASADSKPGLRIWDDAGSLLAWNNGTVPALARAIYEERAWGRLPILCDALEEAGCTDAAILAHCRGPGPHARGCWVIDLLLGKE
jgi:hypothetical protein